MRTSATPCRAAAVMLLPALTLSATAFCQYRVTNLVSDGKIPAAHTDPNLVNAWGIVFNPTGFVWVSDESTSKSTLYDGNGVPQTLVVDIPGVGGPATGHPTGIAFSGSMTDFLVTDGTNSGPARFIFASLDGTVSGWAPAVPPPPPSTSAFVTIDDSAEGSVYTGMALAQTKSGPRLFTVDTVHHAVEAYDGLWKEVKLEAGFADPDLPPEYSPFNAAVIGESLFVAYAQVNRKGEEVPGKGLGIVNEFDFDGKLLRRFSTGGDLNAPWGLVQAPAGFGAFSGALLVGNFGDGTIHAFDLKSGDELGSLNDPCGSAIVIDGLWGLQFGNGVFDQPTTTLFFAAGPEDETQGLYGRIDVAIPADLNGDGHVDGADLGELLGSWTG